ncbi:LOW QUALITY PROTEIN: hypothetical protein OSB04_032103 [Centaurea solstitialis]|uniref:Chromo domain-containing protein n=1 Tax=Centaurea solstitialis TaxID=347529 RepID=A0AA38SAV5_9ASTR|nr:LOW QUALITY PROTEIN: hypothetical protein OSB04_032103 [Centaurea solstitialis]
MNFIDGLPKSSGYNVILVVVNRLSKSAHFVPLKHPYTAVSVALVFMKEIVCVFVGNFWRELFKYQGTVLKRNTVYHPKRMTEVVNRSLETYLRCFTSTRPKEWVKWLPWAEYWYNTSHHSTIGRTPFKVLYGREPPRIILAKIGQVAYRLKLPPNSAIHPVFHLKLVVGDQQVESTLTRELEENWVVWPEKVLEVRSVGGQQEALIAWKGLPMDEATWEGVEHIRQQFPGFHLEDKVSLRGESNDVNQRRWRQVYRRKTGKHEVQGGIAAARVRLSQALLSFGFKGSKTDPSLFIFSKGGTLLYVDDIIITGNNSDAINDIVSKLGNTFPIKDLERLHYFLGIEIVPTGNNVILSQKNYIL